MVGVIAFPTGRAVPEPRPTILSSEWLRGFRISQVLRPDGSSFTVTVPSLGVADGTEHLAPRHRWITDDSGRREPPYCGLVRLAAALSGSGSGTPDPPHR